MTVPWIHLPELTSEAPTQTYLRTYLALWAPPEPVERAFPRELQTKGPLPERPKADAAQDLGGQGKNALVVRW